jgi:putative membrane protein
MTALLISAAIVMPGLAQAAGMTAADYVTKAASGDLYEQESSNIVLASTKNAGLKSFAQDMIKDHTQSSKDVKAAALADHMALKPVKLSPEQSAAVEQLAKAKGTERDTLYATQQKAAHQAALELHQTYGQSGDEPHLKGAAAKIAPVVQHHIEMLNKM